MLVRSGFSLVAAQRKKLNHLHKIATAQSLDYMNSLDRKSTADRELLKVDPALRSLRQRANQEPFPRRPAISPSVRAQVEDRLLEEIIAPHFKGRLTEVVLSGFGSISVEHGDLLQSKADAIVLPLPPNLHAARGLSLRFMEKAGSDFARLFFRNAREVCGEPTRHGVPVGTVILVDGKNCGIGNFKRLFFVVMPSYWQGNTTDARRRFRFALQEIFRAVQQDAKVSSLALAHVGRGIFGFDHEWTWRTLAEELVDSGLLQIGNSKAIGNLYRVDFVEEDAAAAESLKTALEEFLDERSSLISQQTSPEATPLVVLHTMGELNKAKRVDKVKFRKYSGIVRNLRLHYKRFIRPHLWRSAVMNPVSDQPGIANPHFYRGVTHTLFPSRENSAFAGNLKRSGSGRLAPRMVSVQRRIQEQSKPRL